MLKYIVINFFLKCTNVSQNIDIFKLNNAELIKLLDFFQKDEYSEYVEKILPLFKNYKHTEIIELFFF